MTNQKPAITRLAVKQNMTIDQAAAQKQEFLSALEHAQHLELDLHAVAEIDLAGLQLLLLAKREAAQQGKTLDVIGHSTRVQQVLDFCNLVGTFGDPMVISARSTPASQAA